jgi:hypothetical protein
MREQRTANIRIGNMAGLTEVPFGGRNAIWQ